MKRNRISAIFLFCAIFVACGAMSHVARAGTTPLSGFMWSSTAGWISVNSTNPEVGLWNYPSGTSTSFGSYGMVMSTTSSSVLGTLSGYAWSPTVGWISFNQADTNNCPTSDVYDSSNAISGCTPTIDLSSGKVTGWARAISGTSVSGGNASANSPVLNWSTSPLPGTDWTRYIDMPGSALSSDGKYAVFASNYNSDVSGVTSNNLPGNIYLSSSYGANLATTTAPGNMWRSVACSNDCTYIYAGDGAGDVYMSSNRGATWSHVFTTGTTPNTTEYVSIVASANGQYALISKSDHVASPTNQYSLYRTSNYGATWTAVASAGAKTTWTDVAMSSDGHYMAAVSYADTAVAYLSSDYGVTWTASGVGSHPIAVKISDSGRQIVVLSSGSVNGGYISIDGGTTWSTLSLPGASWVSIAMSRDGSHIAALNGNSGNVYSSTDYGSTWNVSNQVIGQGQLSSSADGLHLALGTHGFNMAYLGLYDSFTVKPTLSQGWDGWIHLSGTNHTSPDPSPGSYYDGATSHGVTYIPPSGLTPGTLSGFAWSGAQETLAGIVVSTSTLLAGSDNYYTYQFISVTNNTNSTLSGIRAVEATPLAGISATGGAVLMNQSGVDNYGYQYLQYNYPLTPGQTVILTAKYFNWNIRGPAIAPGGISYIVSAVPPAGVVSEPTIPAGSTVPTVTWTVNSISAHGNFPAANRIHFNVPMGTAFAYGLQYSDDGGLTKHTMYGPGATSIVSTASWYTADFYDYGPGDSMSSPPSSRIYYPYVISGSPSDRTIPDGGGLFIPSISPSDDGILGWINFCVSAYFCTYIGTSTQPSASTFTVGNYNIPTIDNSNNTSRTGTASVAVTGTGPLDETIAMSTNSVSLPSGISITSGPTPSTCTVSATKTCTVSYNVSVAGSNTVSSGAYGSFVVKGTRSSDGATQSGTVNVLVSNSGLPPGTPPFINLWANSLTASTTRSLIIPALKTLPLFWEAKGYGYCQAYVPTSPTGSSGYSGWTGMATTTTDRSTDALAKINSTAVKLASAQQIRLDTPGSYTFKLSCLPVDESTGIKTSNTYVDSPIINVRVTKAAVKEL